MNAYLFDLTLKQEMNRQGQNYWELYLQEIGNQLGVSAQALSPAQLADRKTLEKVHSLVIGAQSGSRLSGRIRENLQHTRITPAKISGSSWWNSRSWGTSWATGHP